MKKLYLLFSTVTLSLCSFAQQADDPSKLSFPKIKSVSSAKLTAPSAPANAPCATPTVSTAAAICDSGYATIIASGASGYGWYASPTGGSPLSSNDTLSSPKLYANTTYYVEALCNDTTMMPLPAYSGGYTGDIRGYYFTAPTTFTVTGLRVPTDASTSAQTIEIVRFTAGAPPAYPSLTNSFVSLGYWNGVNSTTVINCNITVNAGDVIGIYGWRGTTNSYSAGGSYVSNIAGSNVTLERTGMQFDLNTQQMHDVWSEPGGAISRVEMYYSLLGDTSTRVSTVVTVNNSEFVSKNEAICSGDSIFAGGDYQSAAGSYYDTLATVTGCDSVIQTVLTVNALPTISLSAFTNDTVCADSGPVSLPSATPTGGIYGGTGISGSDFDPSLSGTGTFYISYSVVDGNSCTNSDSTSISVSALPAVSISSFADDSVCGNNPAVALPAGSPAGGVYSGTGIAGNDFDPSVSGAGTFDVVYTYSDILGCSGSDTAAITVLSAPVVLLSAFATDSICENDAAVLLPGATPAGGTYSGTGVTGNMFDPSQSGSGLFTINYSYTDTVGCSDTASTDIFVDLCLGISNVEQNSFNLYPNPTGDLVTVTVNGETDGIIIQLTDVRGRLLLEKKASGPVMHISLNEISAAEGIYFLRMIKGNTVVTRKFSKI